MLTVSLATAGSPVAGFARFLHLVGSHPWRERPLVVDPSAQLTPAQHKHIQSTFDAAKAEGGVKGFTICTPKDMEGSAWAQEGLSPAMRQRLVKLAGKSLEVLKVCKCHVIKSLETLVQCLRVDVDHHLCGE